MNIMPAAVLSVLVQARGISAVNAGLTGTQANLQRTGASAMGMSSKLTRAAKIGAAALAVTLGLGFSAAVSKGMEFEKRMSSLGAVTEATTRQQERLEKQSLRLGEATAFSANETAEAQIELAKGGLTVKQILGGALSGALSLAAAGELELADAATATVNAMKLFSLSGRESRMVADMLATAANTTTADVADFAMALTQGGSAAKQAGLSINDTIVILEALAEAGIKNSDAGTSMKAAILQLLAPTKKQAKLAEELGLSWIDQNGEMKSGAAIAIELRGALGGMEKAQRVANLKVLAGTDGFRALAALYDAGPAKLERLARANLQQGTAQEVAARKMDNLSGDVEQLGGALETLQLSLMGGASPALREVTQRATEFVQAINQVVNNPALTEEEKVTRIFTMISAASATALTEIVEQAARFGPRFVTAFATGIFNAWGEMDPLAKVLTVAVLVKALPLGRFSAAGVVAGRALGVGVATGAASTVAGGAGAGAAGGAAAGGLLGKLRGIKWARVGGIGLGIALADATLSEFSRRTQARSEDLGEALEAMRGPKVLGLDLFGDLESATDKIPLVNRIGFLNEDEKAARNISAQYDEMLDKRVRLSRATIEGLAAQSEELNTTKEQRAQLDRMFAVMRAGRRLGVKVDLNMDPDKLNQLAIAFGGLRSGIFTSMEDIQRVVSRNMGIVRSELGTKSAEGRKLAAQNFNAAGKAIEQALESGAIPRTKEALDKMRSYFRNAKLISGNDPLGIAKGFADSWEKAGGVNNRMMARMIADLGKMPKGARQKAFDAMLAYAQGLVQKGKLPLDAFRDMRSRLLSEFDGLRAQAGKKGDELADRLGDSFGDLNTNVGAALQGVISNTRNALEALGVKGAIKQFALDNPGFVYGTGTSPNHAQKKQDGGFIVPGTGTGDTFNTALPVGSFVENREAVRRLPFQDGGMVPVALEPGERVHYPESVRRIGPHVLRARNEAAPRFGFQKGGEIGKPQLAGPAGPLLDIGRGAIDKTHAAALAFLAKQRPDAGVALGSASGSLRAAMGLAQSMGLTITSTTGGSHTADSWHYKGRAFDASNGVDTPEMRRYATAAAGRWGKQMLELFYDPLGWYIKNGAKVSGAIGGHSDHVHTAMQLGGLVKRLAKGGNVRGAQFSPFEEEVQRAAGKAWNRAAPLFGRSPGDPMPMLYVAQGMHARSGHVGEVRSSTGRYGRMVYLDQRWAGRLANGANFAEGALLHEWAHVFQKSGLDRWELEGGATQFQRYASPIVFGNGAGGWPAGYRGFAERVQRERGDAWIRHGQFMQGAGAYPDARTRTAASAAAATGVSVPRAFAAAVKRNGAGFKPALSLFEAGIVETRLKNLPYGDLDSTGALQVRAGTAEGLGIDAMSPGQVADAFLRRGFWGKGGAMSIAAKNPSLTAGAIAQLVQGSAYPERYDQAKGEALSVMKRHGLTDLGVGELTEGQKTIREAKARKSNYERKIARLRKRVADARTLPAKQSALWRLMQTWGRVGVFDEGERSHILDAVQRASAKVDPEGSVKILGNLAQWSSKHGEITGRDPDNFRSLTEAIERAQKRGREERSRTVKRHAAARRRKIGILAARGNFGGEDGESGWVGELRRQEAAYNEANQAAERLVALEPEDITDSYVDQERGAWGAVLGHLGTWRDATVGARDHAANRKMQFEADIAGIEAFNVPGIPQFIKRYKKLKWKLPGLREAVTNARTFLDERHGELGDLQGVGGPQGKIGSVGEGTPYWLTLGGPGARIFDTQNTIRELALKVGQQSDAGESESDRERADLLEQLLREKNVAAAASGAQSAVMKQWDLMRQGFGFAGMFATGGTIPKGQWGIVGERGPEPAFAGSSPLSVFSNRQGQEMFGGGGGNVDVQVTIKGDVVPDKGVDPSEVAEVLVRDPRTREVLRRAVLSGRGAGVQTAGDRGRR